MPPEAAAEKLILVPMIPEEEPLTVRVRGAATVTVANAEPILPFVSVAFTVTV